MQTDDTEGDRPIHLAVRRGHLPLVKWLVGKGVSVNCTDGRHTPLHTAVYFNEIDLAYYLLHEGSQVYFRTKLPELYTPLDMAAYLGNLDMVDLLIQYGANVNACDQKTRFTALHFAAQMNNLEILKHLKQNGGDIMGV
jgi:ankyrin repeat protein